MTDQQKQPNSTQRREVHERSDSFTTIYANNVNLEMSPWEFKLVFGEVMVATNDEFRVLDKIAVNVTPQHIKSVIHLLVRNLHQYEQQFGKLPDKIPGANIEFSAHEPDSD